MWRSTSGVKMTGRVEFDAVGGSCTRVSLHLDYEPEGVLENAVAAFGLVQARVGSDLLRFKEFIENAIVLPDGWRGEIHADERPSTSCNSSKMGDARMPPAGFWELQRTQG